MMPNRLVNTDAQGRPRLRRSISLVADYLQRSASRTCRCGATSDLLAAGHSDA
jgi:hypothetical protein